MTKLAEAIDIAVEQARKSNGPFKHGCVVMSGKNVIAKGHNHIRRNIGTLSIHAEMDSVWKIMDSDQYSNKKAVIVRLSNGATKLANSRPCSICMGLLKQHGITTIAYSTASGSIQLEQI